MDCVVPRALKQVTPGGVRAEVALQALDVTPRYPQAIIVPPPRPQEHAASVILPVSSCPAVHIADSKLNPNAEVWSPQQLATSAGWTWDRSDGDSWTTPGLTWDCTDEQHGWTTGGWTTGGWSWDSDCGWTNAGWTWTSDQEEQNPRATSATDHDVDNDLEDIHKGLVEKWLAGDDEDEGL